MTIDHIIKEYVFQSWSDLRQKTIAGLILSLVTATVAQNFAVAQNTDWMREARIYGMSVAGVQIDTTFLQLEINQALAQGANVIEGDSRLSDFLNETDFRSEVQRIAVMVNIIHKSGLHVVWYYPSLEMITPNGRLKTITLGRQRPDWLQVGFDRESRGLFYGQKEFWMSKDDESAWFCPNSPYRKWLQARLQRLAQTGVDGIWLDVPLLIVPWGCACPYCQEKFEHATGLKFPTQFDVANQRFWHFLQWRHSMLKEFIEDCQRAISASNPKTQTIVEVVSLDHLGATEWGIEGSTLNQSQVAWEVDGASETTAMADASYEDWLTQYSIYKYCRGATANRPAWAFCYGFNAPDAQLVMAGAIAAQNNPYELRVPQMNTSVGCAFRGKMYRWLAQHSQPIYQAQSLAPVLIIYSARNRDFLDTMYEGGLVVTPHPPDRDRQWMGTKVNTPLNMEYLGDYRGLALFCLQHQIPIDIIPINLLTLEKLLEYQALILPYMAMLNMTEQNLLLQAVHAGASLIVSGPEPGAWDENGARRLRGLWHELRVAHSGQRFSHPLSKGRIHFWQALVGRQYLRTQATEISMPLLAWLQEARVEPWITQPARIVVQPYIFENQILLHLLNYSWVGKLNQPPQSIKIELAIPWRGGPTITRITQSEPGWNDVQSLSFTVDNGKLLIPVEFGIHALVQITARQPIKKQDLQ